MGGFDGAAGVYRGLEGGCVETRGGERGESRGLGGRGVGM